MKMKRLTLIKSQKVTGWLSENFEIQVSADTEEQCFFEVSLTLAYLRARPYICMPSEQVAPFQGMNFDSENALRRGRSNFSQSSISCDAIKPYSLTLVI